MQKFSLEKLFIFFALVLNASDAFALHAGDDEFKSPGARAVRFEKAPAYWIDQRYGLFDGLVSNDQTSSKRYDRRLGFGLGFGLEQPLSSVFSLRLDMRGDFVKRRQLDAASPETRLDESYASFRPMAAVTYITPAGLEIFAGGSWSVLPGYTQTIKSGTDTTSIKYHTIHFMTPHVGLTRRGAIGAGGVYYQFGREQKRNVVKNSADGSVLEMTETKQDPTTLGVFSQFSGLGAVWSLDFAAVSEGEGGERAESGSALRDDHLELATRAVWLGSWKTGVFYQTARYSRSAYMSLDTIPMGGAEFMWVTDSAGQKFHLGGIAAFGRDKQSIPEVNARYEVNALSMVGGIQSGF